MTLINCPECGKGISDKGFTKTHTHTFTHSDGSQGTSMQTVWTEAGRKFIHGLLG